MTQTELRRWVETHLEDSSSSNCLDTKPERRLVALRLAKALIQNNLVKVTKE